MEQFRRFYEDLNQIILNDKYAFAYTFCDGFSERLLFAEFTIDWSYTFRFSMRASTDLPEFFVEGPIPAEIDAYFHQLIESDFMSLKADYGDRSYMTDNGGQQFLINLDKITKHIEIEYGVSEKEFETPVEKLLFAFNEYLKNWVETKYQEWEFLSH